MTLYYTVRAEDVNPVLYNYAAEDVNLVLHVHDQTMLTLFYTVMRRGMVVILANSKVSDQSRQQQTQRVKNKRIINLKTGVFSLFFTAGGILLLSKKPNPGQS